LIVGVLSLAIFMSSLDLFIVNLAFPYISHDFPRLEPGLTELGLERLLDPLRRGTRAGRALGRSHRSSSDVRRRSRRVHLGSMLSGVAPNVSFSSAPELVQAIGAGMMVPASLSLLFAAVPGHAARAGHRHVVGDRRTRRGARSGDRRLLGRTVVALGLLDQHPRRCRHGDPRLSSVAREPDETVTAAPTYSVR
jgi:hypothetical protein